MIRFLTLGTTELTCDDSSTTSSQVIAQPKRLALLAYLAISRPGCRHYRDTLLALLWPDLDTGSARHALRQALYHLRRELGARVVMGGNQPGVFVNPELLWCDAVAFEEAVAHGRLEVALDLYRGEFLPGFYADGGPDFEQWVDSVREHLQAEAVAAAWTLTDQAEAAGDFREACAWARRIVALKPCDEGGGRRLIRLLAATGQRAEALQVYEALAARLERTLGLDAAPETRALAAAVREGAPDQFMGHYRGAAGDGRRSRDPATKPVLAVLPFADLTGTNGSKAFAEGLTELLITELAARERAPVSVLSRTSVRQYSGRDCPLPVIARELGAAFVVEGSVLVSDGRVRVTGQLLATTPERHLWAESFDGQFADLLALQAQLAERMADLVASTLNGGPHGLGLADT
jgi:DNA-binding SARP family transcriptional activator